MCDLYKMDYYNWKEGVNINGSDHFTLFLHAQIIHEQIIIYKQIIETEGSFSSRSGIGLE